MTTKTTSARHSELMHRNVTVQRFGRTVAGFICDTVDSKVDEETTATYVGISPRAAQDCNISGEWINLNEVTFTDQPPTAQPAKTFGVCPDAPQPTIRVNTDGAIEEFTFRRKAQADRRIAKLIRAGYTFDATHETLRSPTETINI